VAWVGRVDVGLGGTSDGVVCSAAQAATSTANRREWTTARRGPTDNLLPGLIIAGSTGGAQQCVPRRGGETGYKNDSPSSVGSRRRENERRKKT
jgi:hypothetical protein